MLAHKSFQQALNPFLISRIDYNPSVIWISSKNSTCPLGKLRTKITSPIAKSSSPGLSDMTFFTQTLTYEVPIEHSVQIITFVVAKFQFQHT